jgi:hypothetical protein
MSEKFVEKIEKLSGTEKKSDSLDLMSDESMERVPPNKEHFDQLLLDPTDRGPGKVGAVASSTEIEATRPSLVQDVKNLDSKVIQMSHGQVDDMVAAADQIVDQIHTIKTQLASSADTHLPSSVRRLLSNRLEHIDENLKIALNKAGVEYVPPLSATEQATPIERFLGMLTNGQSQLESLTGHIKELQINGKELSPANMLLIQIKVGTVQQEIEFFTSMLNKGLESTKTLMNVQV